MYIEIKSDIEFQRIAISSYDNPKLTTIDEFNSDIRKISNMRIELSKFIEDESPIRLRKLVNYVVIIVNCFGIKNAIPLIRYKMKTEEQLSILESIFGYLGYTDSIIIDRMFYKLENI